MFARRWWPAAGVLIGMLALPLVSQGAVLTFAFEGHVTGTQGPVNLLGFGGLGSQVVYTFTFDTTAPDAYPEDETAGQYLGLSASLGVDDARLQCQAPYLQIVHPRDYFNVWSYVDLVVPGLDPGGTVHFGLYDQTESNALTSTSLPTEPYPLGPFHNREFSMGFSTPNPAGGSAIQVGMWGAVDAFCLVPEPACMTALAVAAAICRRGSC